MARAKIVIRRRAPGMWVVMRPAYGFSQDTITTHVNIYPTWRDACRSLTAVSLGGAGSTKRESGRGKGTRA